MQIMTKSKYLLIESSGINIKNLKSITIEEIFDKYQIPTEYQKIILRNCLYTSPNPQKEFYELTTDIEFSLLCMSQKHDCFLLCSENSNGNRVFIKSNYTPIDKELVNTFYQGIIDKNLALNYELAVNEIIGIKKKVFKKTRKK